MPTHVTDAAPTAVSTDQAGALAIHHTRLRETYKDDAARRALRRRVGGFQTPVLASGLSQTLTSIGGYLAVCAAMYAVAGISFWLVLALAPLAAGFLVRTFIIQHDCGHGAYLGSRRANDLLGAACSLFTLAPYGSWRRQHAGHHGVWNNLDRRDTGLDIYSTCLTVDEYRALGPWQRRSFRISRSTIIANLVVPPLVFLVLFRFPYDMPAGWRRERNGVYLTNLALLVLYGGAGAVLGFGTVALVHLPSIALAAIAGAWLFTVQHRSENVVWERESDWDGVKASLEGTNYLRLPGLLQWFTGNIGLHHIHHLNPRIPNYRLQACHDSVATAGDVPAMTLGGGLRAMFYVLWDERRRRMVTFRGERRGQTIRR